MALTFDPKDPNEVLDYVVDWSARLVDDTIDASTWVFPSGITKDSDTHDDQTATVWISGGTAGTSYALLNRITSAGGRIMDQTVKLKCKDK